MFLMKNMFNVTTVLPHNLLQTNPCIRHNFSTQIFRKRAAPLHYVGPELRYIFWPRRPSEAGLANIRFKPVLHIMVPVFCGHILYMKHFTVFLVNWPC